jgi:predicted PurR-regulated permease PerM
VTRIELSLRSILLVLGVVAVAWFIYAIRDTLLLLIFPLLLMATLQPLVRRAEHHGLAHGRAVTLVMLGLVLIPAAFIAILIPLVVSEARDFTQRLPALQQNIETLLQHWGVADRVNTAIDGLHVQEHAAGWALGGARSTLSIATSTLLVIAMTGYLLSDSERLYRLLHEFIPDGFEPHIDPVLCGIERTVGGYMRGQVLTSVIFGGYATLLCLLLGVPNALLFGVIAAIGDIIPLVGMQLACAITMVAAYDGSLVQPLAVLGGYVVYGQLESHVIGPRIYAREVNLSPLAIIVATLIGTAVDGVRGLLIAVPVLGAVKVMVDYALQQRQHGSAVADAAMSHTPTDQIGEQDAPAPAGSRLPSAEYTGQAFRNADVT